ncbi:unnamed protein product [Caenorhabditis auriculariae]|uniref:Receptor L-domain domain-containing protein n=1 Tax=Caenorhabditis auriculariae TaxID=2777116 RepID=A0A8S1H8I3_9PELO|nr:unnamed protein product [Caenorhabditis auriculariae]
MLLCVVAIINLIISQVSTTNNVSRVCPLWNELTMATMKDCDEWIADPRLGGKKVVVDAGRWTPEAWKNVTSRVWSLRNVTIFLNATKYVHFDFSSFTSFKDSALNVTSNNHLLEISFNKTFDDFSSMFGLAIKLRGNGILPKRIIDKVAFFCAQCDIQAFRECSFPNPIQSDSEYEKCNEVYGNMMFGTEFREIYPLPLFSRVRGCIHVVGTRIKDMSFLNHVDVHCEGLPMNNVIANNLYACHDRFNHDPRFKLTVKTEFDCLKGECLGDKVTKEFSTNYLGCSRVQSDLTITNSSGSFDIMHLSSIREIIGQLTVRNHNASVFHFPLLRKIESQSCPALRIENMTNLARFYVSPLLKMSCEDDDSPVVVIRNNTKLRVSPIFYRTFQNIPHELEGVKFRGDEQLAILIKVLTAIVLFMTFLLFAEVFVFLIREEPEQALTTVSTSGKTKRGYTLSRSR